VRRFTSFREKRPPPRAALIVIIIVTTAGAVALSLRPIRASGPPS